MPEGIRGQPLRFSRFHCREMLYDYMNGRLDRERHEAVEAGLKEFPELKEELGAMVSAVHYCAELAQIKPQQTLVHNLQQIRLKSEIVSEKVKYKNWPDLLRWSSEAIVISIFVAAIGWLIPWGSVRNIFKIEPANEIVLADLSAKTSTEVVVPSIEEKSEEKTEEPVEANPEKPVETPAPALAVKPPAKTETVAKVEPPKVEAPKVPAVVVAPTLSTATTPATAAKPTANQVPEKKAGPKGFLYRLMMNVAGIQNSAPKLRDQIIAMGGKKAGEVEIGHRQPRGNYFHFSMPEANYQTLLKTLGTYGPVRIYKGPHERVMPAGTIRIILSIEDAKGKSAPKEAAAPATTETATGSTTETNETPGSSEAPAEPAQTTEGLPADDSTSAGE